MVVFSRLSYKMVNLIQSKVRWFSRLEVKVLYPLYKFRNLMKLRMMELQYFGSERLESERKIICR